MGDKKLANRADAEKVEGKKARKTEIAMGDCITSDPERVGKEWRKEQQIEGIGDC